MKIAIRWRNDYFYVYKLESDRFRTLKEDLDLNNL